MNLTSFLRRAAQKHSLTVAVKKKVDAIHEDLDLGLMPSPEQRREMGDFVRSLRERKPYFLMDFWNDARRRAARALSPP